jgi:hypothetical protein
MNTSLKLGSMALATALLTGCAFVSTSHSGYAGQEARNIKSLSESDIAAYLEGKGQGFAKPAELNGYPGPMHVLELSDRLALTAEQQAASQALLKSHKKEVRDLGREYIAAEAALEKLFASKAATPETLALAVRESAQLQSRIRAAHLETHLKQTALLTTEQIANYQRLRGYQ